MAGGCGSLWARVRPRKSAAFSFRVTPPALRSAALSRADTFSVSRHSTGSNCSISPMSASKVVSAEIDLDGLSGLTRRAARPWAKADSRRPMLP